MYFDLIYISHILFYLCLQKTFWSKIRNNTLLRDIITCSIYHIFAFFK